MSAATLTEHAREAALSRNPLDRMVTSSRRLLNRFDETRLGALLGSTKRVQGPARHGSRSSREGHDPASEPAREIVAQGITIEDFRSRLSRGEVSLERWHECSIDPADVDGLDGDPFGPEYTEAVMTVWRRITGRPSYSATIDEALELDGFDYLSRPFPYSSGDPFVVSKYFGAVAAAVGRLGCSPPARVIEYGAGWGHLSLQLALTGFEVTAVDLSSASVELLRRRAERVGASLNVFGCSFLEFEPAELADAIIFFESFHHCERPFELLDRCVKQLTPAGRIILLADAIYDNFYAPWGVRLDGAAVLMSAQNGWLELGFRRDFFTHELERRGFRVTWEVLPSLGDYGTILTACRVPGEVDQRSAT